MQTLCLSRGSITIWWNALIISTLLNTFEPAILSVKLLRFGRGNKSKVVIKLNKRKSPTGRRDPFGFGTKCKGDVKVLGALLSTLSMMPSFSSSLTAFSPSTAFGEPGGYLLTFARHGLLSPTSIRWITPFLGSSELNDNLIRSGNFLMSSLYSPSGTFSMSF